MFVPSCNRCGQCGCVCGALPYTLTVEFAELVDTTHSQHCELMFVSCFGTGAAGVAMTPGGDDPEDRGALTGVLLTESGCGYAVLGREAPAVSVTGSGNDATFVATLSQSADACSRPVWQVGSVAVSGGTGYTDGEALSVAIDGIVTTAPALTLRCERSSPTLTATVAGGSGVVLSASVSPNGTTPATWGVSSVTVLEAGSGYTNGASVVFDAGDGIEVASAVATIVAGGQPGDSDIAVFEYADSSASSPSTGSGAQYAYTFTPDGELWLLSVTVTDGGSGYEVGNLLEFVRLPLETSNGVSLYSVTAVDENGAITAISLDVAEGMVGGGGGIASVTITNAGQYFNGSGIPDSIQVGSGGQFYAENPALPPIVADVTVTAPACGGTGEEITATVNSTPGDPAFGRITGLSVENGGENHLAWAWLCTNYASMNGEPIVLVADNPTKLVTLDVQAAFGSGGCLRVVPVGNGTTCDPPIAALYDGQPGPIRQVEIVSGGSGYAKLGRERPQWTAASYGWTFTPNFGSPVNDSRGLPGWAVVSFAISGSGSNTIPNGHLIPVVLSGQEYVEQHVVATVTVVDGVPTNVTVSSGGRYYRENPALAPLVSTPTVSIVQLPPSNGAGAALSVTVDDDPQSNSFGEIVSVSFTGGSGYTILGGPLDCSYTATPCPAMQVSLELRGHARSPLVRIEDGATEIVFVADDVLDDCNNLPATASLWYGAPSGSVTITRGGTVATECALPSWCTDEPFCGYLCVRTLGLGCYDLENDPAPSCPEGWDGPFESSASNCFICTQQFTADDCAECEPTFGACYITILDENGQALYTQFEKFANSCEECADAANCNTSFQPFAALEWSCNPFP